MIPNFTLFTMARKTIPCRLPSSRTVRLSIWKLRNVLSYVLFRARNFACDFLSHTYARCGIRHFTLLYPLSPETSSSSDNACYNLLQIYSYGPMLHKRTGEISTKIHSQNLMRPLLIKHLPQNIGSKNSLLKILSDFEYKDMPAYRTVHTLDWTIATFSFSNPVCIFCSDLFLFWIILRVQYVYNNNCKNRNSFQILT